VVRGPNATISPIRLSSNQVNIDALSENMKDSANKLTHQPTQWSRIFPENLTGRQIIVKVP
jgi:hypothetical protein